MNKKLFFIIQNISNKNKLIQEIFIKISKISSLLFIIIYSCEIFFLIINRDKKIFLCLFLPIIVLCVSNIIRNVFKKERPFSELNINPLVVHKNTYSFPSNHSVSSMIISFSLLYVNPIIGIIFIFISILTGLSRIVIGVHYPYDVIAGWFLSIIIGSIGFWILPSILQNM